MEEVVWWVTVVMVAIQEGVEANGMIIGVVYFVYGCRCLICKVKRFLINVQSGWW